MLNPRTWSLPIVAAVLLHAGVVAVVWIWPQSSRPTVTAPKGLPLVAAHLVSAEEVAAMQAAADQRSEADDSYGSKVLDGQGSEEAIALEKTQQDEVLDENKTDHADDSSINALVDSSTDSSSDTAQSPAEFLPQESVPEEPSDADITKPSVELDHSDARNKASPHRQSQANELAKLAAQSDTPVNAVTNRAKPKRTNDDPSPSEIEDDFIQGGALAKSKHSADLAVAGESSPAAANRASRANSEAQFAALYQDYHQQVRRQLAAMQRYPRTAKRRAQEGAPRVAFRVLADGSLQATRLLSSSGHASLDKAALQLLDRANPLPQPPLALRGQPLEFSIALIYELN